MIMEGKGISQPFNSPPIYKIQVKSQQGFSWNTQKNGFQNA